MIDGSDSEAVKTTGSLRPPSPAAPLPSPHYILAVFAVVFFSSLLPPTTFNHADPNTPRSSAPALCAHRFCRSALRQSALSTRSPRAPDLNASRHKRAGKERVGSGFIHPNRIPVAVRSWVPGCGTSLGRTMSALRLSDSIFPVLPMAPYLQCCREKRPFPHSAL